MAWDTQSPTTDLAALWKTLVRGLRLVEVSSQLSSSCYPLSVLTSVFKKESPFLFCQVCPFLFSALHPSVSLGSLCSFALTVSSMFFTANFPPHMGMASSSLHYSKNIGIAPPFCHLRPTAVSRLFTVKLLELSAASSPSPHQRQFSHLVIFTSLFWECVLDWSLSLMG